MGSEMGNRARYGKAQCETLPRFTLPSTAPGLLSGEPFGVPVFTGMTEARNLLDSFLRLWLG